MDIIIFAFCFYFSFSCFTKTFWASLTNSSKGLSLHWTIFYTFILMSGHALATKCTLYISHYSNLRAHSHYLLSPFIVWFLHIGEPLTRFLPKFPALTTILLSGSDSYIWLTADCKTSI